MQAPERVEAFFFRIDHEDGLPPALDALRPLRMDGTLQSACHIGNAYKVLSGLQAYPWEATLGKTPLTPEALVPFAKKFNFGAWNGSGALYGTKRQLAEGFEPMISLTLMTERTVGCVVSIIYDRDVPGEDERAKICHEELLKRLAASGYYPYRLGIQSMAVMQHAGPFGQFLKRLKRELDPKHILAPGRYEV